MALPIFAIASGIYTGGSALETTRAEMDRIFAVNLFGVFFTAQGYAREMVTRRSGSIVAIGSISGRFPRMGQIAYGASKAGIRQALRVLAMETVPLGVRINLISPGPVDSEMMRALKSDHPNVDDLAVGSPAAFRPRVPDGRVGRTEQVAAAAAFLLGPDSAHIAFHDLYLDGGETLGV